MGGVSFNLEYGEVVGIVGESGSGKSVTMMSIMQLLDDNGRAKREGKVKFEDKNLLSLNDNEMSKIRGNEISMIFKTL